MNDEQYVLVREDLVKRLESLNYNADNEFALKFCADKAYHKVLNAINGTEIPDELYEVFIDMACGEILYQMNGTMTEAQKKDVVGAVSRITEGENTIEFDSKYSTQRMFNDVIESLRKDDREQFSRFRKLVW